METATIAKPRFSREQVEARGLTPFVKVVKEPSPFREFPNKVKQVAAITEIGDYRELDEMTAILYGLGKKFVRKDKKTGLESKGLSWKEATSRMRQFFSRSTFTSIWDVLVDRKGIFWLQRKEGLIIDETDVDKRALELLRGLDFKVDDDFNFLPEDVVVPTPPVTMADKILSDAKDIAEDEEDAAADAAFDATEAEAQEAALSDLPANALEKTDHYVNGDASAS